VVDADQKVRVRNVTVGDADGTWVQITSGLDAGDRVVTDGHYRLLPGAVIVEAPENSGGSRP
jgi:multidrug efflux system membrane fusion protein